MHGPAVHPRGFLKHRFENRPEPVTGCGDINIPDLQGGIAPIITSLQSMGTQTIVLYLFFRARASLRTLNKLDADIPHLVVTGDIEQERR